MVGFSCTMWVDYWRPGTKRACESTQLAICQNDELDLLDGNVV